jgi:hypothetical protein
MEIVIVTRGAPIMGLAVRMDVSTVFIISTKPAFCISMRFLLWISSAIWDRETVLEKR